MDAVGDEFDGHAVGQVDAFHSALVLVFAAFVEARHGVVEVGGVGKSGFVGGTDAVVFGFGVRYGCQYAFFAQVACEFQRSGQFGRSVPAADATGAFYKLAVFLFVNLFHLVGKLLTCHFPVEVGAFDVKSQHGAVRFCHEPLAHLGGLMQLVERRRGNGGVEARCAMSEVCVDDAAERFFGTFVEVVSATAVRVHADEAGHDVHAFGVDETCADKGEVAVGHFKDFSVTHQDGTFIQPALRGEYASIDNLS